MKLTRQQEAEIYPILDQTLDLTPGKGILYTCTTARADYLERIIKGLRYDSAIESIEMYEPDSPLYGHGLYADIWIETQDRGLLLTKLAQPFSTPQWQIIQCAATHEQRELHDVTVGAARQILLRMQNKYPNIMNTVWISDAEGISARYGELSPEELLVVDIDVNPHGPLAPPTHQQKAKARVKS